MEAMNGNSVENYEQTKNGPVGNGQNGKDKYSISYVQSKENQVSAQQTAKPSADYVGEQKR